MTQTLPTTLVSLRDAFPLQAEVRDPIPRLGLVPGDWFAYARRLEALPLVEVVRPGEHQGWSVAQVPADRVEVHPAPGAARTTDTAALTAWDTALQDAEEDQ